MERLLFFRSFHRFETICNSLCTSGRRGDFLRSNHGPAPRSCITPMDNLEVESWDFSSVFQAFYGVLVEMLAYCNVLVRGNRFECDRLSRGVLNDFGACHAKLCVLQFRNLRVR